MNLRQLYTALPLLLAATLSACAPPAEQAPPAVREMTDQEVIDRFHEIFYNGPNTWHESKWLGIETLQNPNDVWITQEIITEVAPDFIIETGARRGGSAILWAMILEQVNPDGRVITIDINDVDAASTEFDIWKERVEFRKVSSTDSDLVAELAERTRGKKVLVILDSDHREPHVYDELNAYGPMVNVGSYMIVQDSNVNGYPVLPDYGPGPMEALVRFVEESPSYEIDESRERFLFTMHPKGYLKRVQ